MCGINGFNWSDRELIAKMNQCIAHRGPDDEGEFVAPHISLGARRLAILDLSEKGHQPMRFKNLTITYNGEIYNYPELKKELQVAGYQFRSDSDTEMILAAYDKWGEKCLQRFNGIFAIAIWNEQTEELFLARDHLGVKPLYYYHHNGKFIFSSEIKGILQHGISAAVNTKALNFLLQVLYVPQPQTMFAGIKKLRAGHFARFKAGHFQEQQFWTVTDFQDSPRSFGTLKQDIKSLLMDAVKLQLISDRPLGVFLSGGWDSTTVLGVMRELGIADIQTFSSGFATDNEKYNQDFYLARQTAKYYQTNHHEVVLPQAEVANLLEDVVYHLDEPNAAPTVLPMFYLAKQTKPHATVVLGGDGGDELFAGYPRYWQSYYLNKFQKLPSGIRKSLPYFLLEKLFGKRDLSRKLNTPAGYERFAMFKVYPEEKTRRLLSSGLFEVDLVERYFTENYFSPPPYPSPQDHPKKEDLLGEPRSGGGNEERISLPRWEGLGEAADFEKLLMYVDLKNWLTVESLWKTDRMSSAAGLEYRVPLLDFRLVELAFQIPTRYKIKGLAGKWIFKETVQKYIPEHLRDVKKRGWLTPGNLWLSRELREMMNSVVAGEYCPDMKNYFDMRNLQQLQQEHLAGNNAHLNQLWSALTFAIWYNKFFKS